MKKELKLEANKYRLSTANKMAIENNAFIAGATSKWAESQKLEFAIDLLKAIEQPNGNMPVNKIKLKIEELEQKLSKL